MPVCRCCCPDYYVPTQKYSEGLTKFRRLRVNAAPYRSNELSVRASTAAPAAAAHGQWLAVDYRHKLVFNVHSAASARVVTAYNLGLRALGTVAILTNQPVSSLALACDWSTRRVYFLSETRTFTPGPGPNTTLTYTWKIWGIGYDFGDVQVVASDSFDVVGSFGPGAQSQWMVWTPLIGGQIFFSLQVLDSGATNYAYLKQVDAISGSISDAVTLSSTTSQPLVRGSAVSTGQGVLVWIEQVVLPGAGGGRDADAQGRRGGHLSGRVWHVAAHRGDAAGICVGERESAVRVEEHGRERRCVDVFDLDGV